MSEFWQELLELWGGLFSMVIMDYLHTLALFAAFVSPMAVPFVFWMWRSHVAMTRKWAKIDEDHKRKWAWLNEVSDQLKEDDK